MNDETTYRNELRKTGFIKFAYCFLLLYRTYQILYHYHVYQQGLITEEWIFSIFYVVLVLLMLFRNDWITPLLLVLVQSKFDVYFNIYAVGGTATIFINAWFIAYNYILSKAKHTEGNNAVQFNEETGNIKYLLVMLWCSNAIINLFLHIHDNLWISGEAFGLMACNPFISPFYSTFRQWYLHHTDAYLLISQLIMALYAFMQCILLPLFIMRRTRFLFYVWMFITLLFTTFFIDTSFTAHFSWLLFILLIPQIEFSLKKIKFQTNTIKLSTARQKLNRIVIISIAFIAMLKLPFTETGVKWVTSLFLESDTHTILDRKLGMMGLGKQDIPNSYSTSDAHRWVVIYRKNYADWELVPIMDTGGRKLNDGIDWLHTTNHGSDFLWLANTWQYAKGNDVADYSNSTTPYKLVGPVHERLMRYHYNKCHATPTEIYKVDFYSHVQPDNRSNPFVSKIDSVRIYSCTTSALRQINILY